jgi:hypothetical protein
MATLNSASRRSTSPSLALRRRTGRRSKRTRLMSWLVNNTQPIARLAAASSNKSRCSALPSGGEPARPAAARYLEASRLIAIISAALLSGTAVEMIPPRLYLLFTFVLRRLLGPRGRPANGVEQTRVAGGRSLILSSRSPSGWPAGRAHCSSPRSRSALHVAEGPALSSGAAARPAGRNSDNGQQIGPHQRTSATINL